MRTLAAIAFIAAAAVLAIVLARTPTVADGRVIEADLLAQLREHGVVGLACDPKIPIRRTGAAFSCRATLDDGSTQTIAYIMDRAGGLTATVSSPDASPRIPASADPWAN